MATKLEIINQALILMGESTVSDLTLPVGEVMERLYDDTRDSLLTSHRWRFAMKKVALSEASGTPVNEWDKHFTLPTGMLMLVTTYPTSTYEIYEDKLLTNHSSVSVDYLFNPGEKKFPAYFTKAFSKHLAAEACLSITNDKTLAQKLREDAEIAEARARYRDSQGRPPTAIQHRPFIDVRR